MMVRPTTGTLRGGCNNNNNNKNKNKHKGVVAILLATIVFGWMAVQNLRKLRNDNLFDKANTTTTSHFFITPPRPNECLDLQLDDNVQHRYRPSLERGESHQCLLYEPPSQYVQQILNQVVGLPRDGTCANSNCSERRPYNVEERMFGNDWPPLGYTMIGMARLENFRAAILEVNRNAIPGVIMELGVWRGGAMIAAAAICQDDGDGTSTTTSTSTTSTKRMLQQRDLYVLDAFEEIPATSYGKNHEYLFNTEQNVKDNFQHFGLLSDRVHFVKGLFKHTVPTLQDKYPIQSIAVLRIDGNYYDSYQDAMYYLYGLVPIGGIVIFDDIMSHPAVLQFWNDFKQDQGVTEDIHRIDRHSTWFRKGNNVTINMGKMRPPQDVNKE